MIRLVKETLYEKFTEENSDPIKDMGIGILAPKVFHTQKQLVDYIILVLPLMYDEHIPEDIMKGFGGVIPADTFKIITDFLHNHGHKMKGIYEDGDNFRMPPVGLQGWTDVLKDRLEIMGYKRDRRDKVKNDETSQRTY